MTMIGFMGFARVMVLLVARTVWCAAYAAVALLTACPMLHATLLLIFN